MRSGIRALAVTFCLLSCLVPPGTLHAQTAPDQAERRQGMLLQKGFIQSISVSGSVATAVAGPKLQYIPYRGSREIGCGWILDRQKALDARVTSARIVDTSGNVLAACQ